MVFISFSRTSLEYDEFQICARSVLSKAVLKSTKQVWIVACYSLILLQYNAECDDIIGTLLVCAKASALANLQDRPIFGLEEIWCEFLMGY